MKNVRGLVMGILTATCVAAGAGAAVEGAAGCNSKTAADIELAMSDAQKGCVFAEQMLPALGLPQPALSDVKVACDIEAIADAAVIALIDEFQPQVRTLAATRRPLALKRHK